MQLHQLKPLTRPKREKRVGRGDKTAGRGTKGQRSRAGAKIRPAIRDVLKKLPKRRGYRFRPFRSKPSVIPLKAVASRFESGEKIDSAALLKAGLIRKIKGRIPEVKILGREEIKKKLIFKGLFFSKSARQAVMAAGGTIQVKP